MNADNVSHAITMTGNNTGMFNSGAIVPHGGASYTFGQTGTYTYALVENTTVTGTIIVQAPSTVLSYNVSP
jgi:plastocyanin